MTVDVDIVDDKSMYEKHWKKWSSSGEECTPWGRQEGSPADLGRLFIKNGLKKEKQYCHSKKKKKHK